MTPIERKARELLPCPFCGNADVTDDEGCFQTGGHWEVRCGNPSCFAHEPCGATYDEAVERWNRRTDLTPPAGGLPELPELPAHALAWATPDGAHVAHAADASHQFTDPLFTTDQLHAYALEAIAASRVGELESLRAIAACAYQLAGYHDAPEVWLDRLSEAANGDPLPPADTIIDELLPYTPEAAPQVALNRGAKAP